MPPFCLPCENSRAEAQSSQALQDLRVFLALQASIETLYRRHARVVRPFDVGEAPVV